MSDYEAWDAFRVPEDWICAQRAVECVAFYHRSLMRIPGMRRLTGKWALQDEVLESSQRANVGVLWRVV